MASSHSSPTPLFQTPGHDAGRDDLSALVEAQARFISGARDHAVFAPLLDRLLAATGSLHALVGNRRTARSRRG